MLKDFVRVFRRIIRIFTMDKDHSGNPGDNMRDRIRAASDAARKRLDELHAERMKVVRRVSEALDDKREDEARSGLQEL